MTDNGNLMAAEEDDHKDLREVKTVLRRLQRIGDRLLQVDATSKTPGSAATAFENLANREDVSRPPDRSGERAPSRAGIGSGDADSLADKRPVQGRRLGALALAMLAAGTVIVLAGDLFLKYWPSVPSSTPAATISGGGTSAVVTTEPAEAKTSTRTLPIETSQPVPQADKIDDRASSSTVTAVPANPDVANAHQLMESGRILAARERLRRPDLAASQEAAWLLARSYDPSYLATIQSPDASADQQQAEEWYRRWRDIAVRNGMVMDDLRLKRIINSMYSFGSGNNSPPAGLTSPGRNR
jgi:hypothetical protein